jgi:biotin carboxyl carrier protein
LLVVEAMKMENAVIAPGRTIARIGLEAVDRRPGR